MRGVRLAAYIALCSIGVCAYGCSSASTENGAQSVGAGEGTAQTPIGASGIGYGLGFFPEERGSGGETWRWMGQEGTVILRNSHQDMRLSMVGRIPAELAQPLTITLEFNGQPLDRLVEVRGEVRKEYDIPASSQGDGASSRLQFLSDRTFSAQELDPQSPDARRLSFAVYSLSWVQE